MSTTLSTRMGLAVPSLVEASRGLPSVKADVTSADDDLVTSVAIVAPVDEPVSPELALVDPDLAVRLRALLPEIELQIGLGPPPPVLRVLPDPEHGYVLPLAPPPELVDLSPAPTPLVRAVAAPPLFPSRVDRWRSLAKAFAAGAAVATFVTVGVVAKVGEGPPAQSTDVSPRTVPPASSGAADGAPTGSPAKKTFTTPRALPGITGKPHNAPAKKTQTAAPKRGATHEQAKAPKQSAKPEQTTKPKPAPSSKQASTKESASKPAASTAEPRRFAWAPVHGAIGYRIELFRGAKQVLEERTKVPVYELTGSWRHSGRTERLTPGSYRWYVWPVFSSGPAAKAVVQAQLSVP